MGLQHHDNKVEKEIKANFNTKRNMFEIFQVSTFQYSYEAVIQATNYYGMKT